MGFVDFAIDLAAVLSASRKVASKHVTLRARQINGYNDSTSVAAARKIRPDGSGSQTQAPGQQAISNTDQAHIAATASDASLAYQRRPDNKPEADSSHNGFGKGETKTSNLSAAEAASLKEIGDSVYITSHGSRPNRPTTLAADLRQLRWGGEREIPKLTKLEASPPLGTAEKKAAEEDEVPDGVDLSIFRTRLGESLGSARKGSGDNGAPGSPSSSEGINANELRKRRGSSILEEMTRRKWGIPSANPPDPVQTTTAATVPTSRQFGEEATAQKPRQSARTSSEKAHAASTEIQSGASAANQFHPPVESPNKAQDPLRPEKPIAEEAAALLSEVMGASAPTPAYELRESKVPSSRLGRIWNYGGLAAGMLGGAISESFSRVTGHGGQGSLMLSPANMERLVAKLSKMRGAALKIGQMLSFQDSKMLPAPIQEVLQRVQDRADYMPSWQRDRVLVISVGQEWRALFDKFDEKPIAAASIGQVHRATLASNGAEVAVKIQFPGVADSINSDLDNLGMLLAATKLLPKGLYLNKTIDNARTELAWECDYKREAECAIKYRELLATEDDVFMVPRIYPEASGKQVLTMEFMDGIGVTRVKSFTQDQKDWIGTQILRLCLREITEFRFMQTDPNWTNFLYNSQTNKLVLLDFGATREYPDRFITLYVRLLAAASKGDRDAVAGLSKELGYLTGLESKAMLNAHIASVLTLAEPFLECAPEVYDFRDQTITDRVKAQIPVMIKERLAPPPEETYSLHRKLSGAFLLCARLGSRVRCRELFEKSLQKAKI